MMKSDQLWGGKKTPCTYSDHYGHGDIFRNSHENGPYTTTSLQLLNIHIISLGIFGSYSDKREMFNHWSDECNWDIKPFLWWFSKCLTVECMNSKPYKKESFISNKSLKHGLLLFQIISVPENYLNRFKTKKLRKWNKPVMSHRSKLTRPFSHCQNPAATIQRLCFNSTHNPRVNWFVKPLD